MAAVAQHNQPFSTEPQDSLQWDRKAFEGDGVLDEHILDTNTFDMNAVDQNQRRESFASSASIISPAQPAWPEYAYSADAAHYALSNGPSLYPDHSGNQLSHSDAPPYSPFGAQMPQWQTQTNIGQDPNTDTFQGFTSEAETIKPEVPYSNDVMPPQHPHAYGGLPVHMDSEYPQYPATSAASPTQWSTSSSDAVEKIPRSGHFQSTMFKHNLPQLPRDGVRKKNARFEIPEGHNLQTIDELINRTDPNNEQTLKELKQQKRLLRNRQAALDSRCRKKHHTEKLEEEKKHFLAAIDRLEDDVSNLRMNEQRWFAERQHWHQYSENLVREKEELVRQHTLETADLRRKNTILKEESERLQSVAMSAQSSSAGVSSGFSDFGHLTMDSCSFDDFSFIDHQIMDPEPRPETAIAIQPKAETPAHTTTEDKAAAPGLLLMLLLCGAWVASKSTGSVPAPVPRMPDDVRVASSAILENIYKDAGIPPANTLLTDMNTKTPLARTSSATTVITSSHRTPSFSSLHHDLTQPTEQQQREQCFSLTPDQYNHITTDDDTLYNGPNPAQHQLTPQRRNLADALAAMRAEKKGPAAEIYTRSLMMNEVPADVVRDFARMMTESQSHQQQQQEPLS